LPQWPKIQDKVKQEMKKSIRFPNASFVVKSRQRMNKKRRNDYDPQAVSSDKSRKVVSRRRKSR
jgi:hypothetical protein